MWKIVALFAISLLELYPMQRTGYSFIQHFGHLCAKSLMKHEHVLFKAVLACVLLSVYFYLKGNEPSLVNFGLGELAAFWLGFTYMSLFASLIDALARPGSRVVEVLREPVRNFVCEA